MKMTLKQHKIAALKHAREIIKSGKEEYICYALGSYPDYYLRDIQEERAVHYLKQYIAKNLGATKDYWGDYHNNTALDDWLIAKGHINKFPKYGSKKIRQTRLNWIDWMLACYEGTN